MDIYRVESTFNEGYLLVAIVACEKAGDSFELAGFSGDDYSEQEAIYIGSSVYSEPALICRETL